MVTKSGARVQGALFRRGCPTLAVGREQWITTLAVNFGGGAGASITAAAVAAVGTSSSSSSDTRSAAAASTTGQRLDRGSQNAQLMLSRAARPSVSVARRS